MSLEIRIAAYLTATVLNVAACIFNVLGHNPWIATLQAVVAVMCLTMVVVRAVEAGRIEGRAQLAREQREAQDRVQRIREDEGVEM